MNFMIRYQTDLKYQLVLLFVSVQQQIYVYQAGFALTAHTHYCLYNRCGVPRKDAFHYG